jgi:chromosome segregation ATPase
MLENQKGRNSKNPQEQECPANSAKLDKELDELREKAVRAALDMETQKTLQTESAKAIADLEKALSEFVKIVEDYQKVREKLKQEISNHTDYRRHQEVMIEARVNGKKQEEVDCEITNFEEAIGKIPAVKDAKEAVKTAEENLENAEKDQKEKIAAFEDSKAKQKISEDAIKYLTDLQNSIEKNETENKFAVMYYLIKNKFKDKLESIPTIIDDNSTFKEELEIAWSDMNEANGNVRDRRDKLARAKKYLEVAEEAQKNRPQELEARLIKKLEGIKIDSDSTATN